MEFYHVPLKPYKNIFLQVIIVNVFAIIGSYFIVTYLPIEVIIQHRYITTILLAATVFVAGYHTIYTKKQVSKLGVIEDFN